MGCLPAFFFGGRRSTLRLLLMIQADWAVTVCVAQPGDRCCSPAVLTTSGNALLEPVDG